MFVEVNFLVWRRELIFIGFLTVIDKFFEDKDCKFFGFKEGVFFYISLVVIVNIRVLLLKWDVMEY